METSNANQPLEDGMWDAPQKAGDYAGFWLRLAAALLDGVILSIATYALLGIIIGIFISNDGLQAWLNSLIEEDDMEAFFMAYFGMMGFMIIAQWLYFALMESSAYQATLGKNGSQDQSNGRPGQPDLLPAGYRPLFWQNPFRHDFLHRLHHGRFYQKETGFT